MIARSPAACLNPPSSKALKDSHLWPSAGACNYTIHAAGSILAVCGDTKVLCTASVEESVPPWMRGSEKRVTAEYAMLPELLAVVVSAAPVQARRSFGGNSTA